MLTLKCIALAVRFPMYVKFDTRKDAMKHVSHHGYIHDHLEGADHHIDATFENIFTLLIVASCLFIPFAFVLHFFPG